MNKTYFLSKIELRIYAFILKNEYYLMIIIKIKIQFLLAFDFHFICFKPLDSCIIIIINLRRTDRGIFIPQACLKAHNWVG